MGYKNIVAEVQLKEEMPRPLLKAQASRGLMAVDVGLFGAQVKEAKLACYTS